VTSSSADKCIITTWLEKQVMKNVLTTTWLGKEVVVVVIAVAGSMVYQLLWLLLPTY
jgi:hypothetical protein